MDRLIDEDLEDEELLLNFNNQNNQNNADNRKSVLDGHLIRDFERPVGLKNLGNTCWFNSIIQVSFGHFFLIM
jgi:ubiquitin C-terminal hydrolase